MNTILQWFNDPVLFKTLLLFVGGVVLKRWPAFVNKAIPMVLLVASGAIEIVRTAFPDFVPAAHAAASAVVTHHSHGLWSLVTSVVLPVVAAVGLHSAPKNTLEWAQFGFQVIKKARTK